MSTNYRLIALQELDATLVEAWRTIQANNQLYESPYFCPEFTQMVGRERTDVRVVVIEDGGRPVGFFPYQRSFFGSGKPVGGALSDYHGVIAEAGAEWDVIGLMRSAGLGAWTFDHLIDESRKFSAHVTAHATSPQINLSAGFENYVRNLRNPPSDFARKARKLEREIGKLHFKLHETGDGALDRLFEWKSEQYRKTRLFDVFGVRWTGALLRRVMSTQSPRFSGVCSVLRAGDRIVAVHGGMRSGRVLHWWFPTYDPEFGKYSPGIVLLLRIAEAVAAMGVSIIDLGKGDAQYKTSLMNGAVDLLEGFVEAPSLLACARQLRRAAEARAVRGGIGTALRLPLRALRKFERTRRFR